MREDIFQRVDAAWKVEKERNELDEESKRLLEKERKSYVRNGLGIEKGPKRDRFKEIKKRLSQVCNVEALLYPAVLLFTCGGISWLISARFKLNSRKTLTRRTVASGSREQNWKVFLRMCWRHFKRALEKMRGSCG
jgi:hypothetical protein